MRFRTAIFKFRIFDRILQLAMIIYPNWLALSTFCSAHGSVISVPLLMP